MQVITARWRRNPTQDIAASGGYQLHLALFRSHVMQAVEQEAERRAQRREGRAATVRARRRPRMWSDTQELFDALDPQQLHEPLLETGGSELDCVPSLDLYAPVEVEPAQAGVDFAGWSDQAMLELHEAVLMHSLEALKSRGNGAEKRDVLKWIFAPQRYVATLTFGGRAEEVLLPPELTPFSFEMCCRICNYHSSAVMDGLKYVLHKKGLGHLFNEIAQ